jgi:ABC-type lipoprotein export system ATPase subunit
VGRSERRDRARQALDAVGLLSRQYRSSDELSGGQQQRVAVARAAATNPTVLLADEPTGNLDSTSSHEVMELLAELNRAKGITVVMVTHDPEMAAYAQRVVTVLDGHIVSDTLRDNRDEGSVVA